MTNATKKKTEIPPKVWAVIVAILLVVGGGNWVYERLSGDDEAATSVQATEGTSVDWERTERVEEDLELNFSGAAWYSLIETVEVRGDTLYVKTILPPTDEVREDAKFICNGLNANYIISHTADYGLERVTVYAQGDRRLAWTSPLSGRC